MDWLGQIFDKEFFIVLVPIVVIVSAFAAAALSSHYKHLERIKKIEQGFNPDE